MLNGGVELADVRWWQDKWVYLEAIGWVVVFFGVWNRLVPWLLKTKERGVLWAGRLTALAILGAVITLRFDVPDGAEKWGDFVGGFFAIPALIWFVTAVFLQMDELQLQRAELKLQREESRKIAEEAQSQSKLMSVQAHIAAMEYIDETISKLDFDTINSYLDDINFKICFELTKIEKSIGVDDIICVEYVHEERMFCFDIREKSPIYMSNEDLMKNYFSRFGVSFVHVKKNMEELIAFAKITGLEETILTKLISHVDFMHMYFLEYLFLKP